MKSREKLYTPPPPRTWAKWGRFVIFPVLCLLVYGDIALKSWFLLAFGARTKGRDSDTFRAVFPSIWVSWDPQTLQNKGKRKMTNQYGQGLVFCLRFKQCFA